MQELTVLILTYNEELNIGRTLQSVSWAGRILIVDSGSSDGTSEISSQFSQVEVLSRPFDNHANQWNFGLERIATPWVLTLDADYVLPANAAGAVSSAINGEHWGYTAHFDYLVAGRPIKGSVLPPRIVLFRTPGSRFHNDGHTQRLQKDGSCGTLPFRIAHDDRKPLGRWLASQIKYAELEAEKLDRASNGDLSINDLLRKLLILAPPMVFLLVYVLRGGFLSGWRGLFYALQRSTAEVLLSLYLIERLIKRRDS